MKAGLEVLGLQGRGSELGRSPGLQKGPKAQEQSAHKEHIPFREATVEKEGVRAFARGQVRADGVLKGCYFFKGHSGAFQRIWGLTGSGDGRTVGRQHRMNKGWA